MTEPIRKNYHTNDKVDNIPKKTVGVKRVRPKPYALHKQKPTVMRTYPCEANGYISLPSQLRTLTNGEAYRQVLRGLTWSTRMFLYGNILLTTYKDPTT